MNKIKKTIDGISLIIGLFILTVMIYGWIMMVFGIFRFMSISFTILSIIIIGLFILYIRQKIRTDIAEETLRILECRNTVELLKSEDFILPEGFTFELPEENIK